MNLKKIFANTLANSAMALGYDAAERSYRRKDLGNGRRSTADEDRYLTSYGRNEIIAKSLDLSRNNMIVSGVIDRMCDHVVGGGITPQAKTSNEVWNNEAEQFWAESSKIIDSRLRMNMEEFQRSMVISRFVTGDCGFVFTSGGQLQPIEGTRIGTPDSLKSDTSIVDGIRLDSLGRIKSILILPRKADGTVDKSAGHDEVDAANFMHVTRNIAGRFDQVRGVPMLASVVNALQDFGEVSSAMVMRAKMDAYNAWQVTTKDGSGPGNMGDRNADPSVGGTQYDRFDDLKIYYMSEGEKAESLASNTPNPQHVGFMVHNLRLIGSAIGIPYEFLLLDFSQGNYSVSRAALLETHQTFTKWQRWVSLYMQRIWNFKIAKAIKDGTLGKAPVDYRGISEWYKVQWQYPEFGWIDPQSQASADQIEYNLCTTTLTKLASKKGADFNDLVAEKGTEIQKAIEIAEAIKKSTGVSVAWQHLISAYVPGGAPVDVADDSAPNKNALPQDSDKLKKDQAAKEQKK